MHKYNNNKLYIKHEVNESKKSILCNHSKATKWTLQKLVIKTLSSHTDNSKDNSAIENIINRYEG